MQIIRVTDGDQCWSAHKVPSLSSKASDLATIVDVLVGQHQESDQLLYDVKPGSVAESLGARQYVVLAFDEAPPGGFGVGGVYGVVNWVIHQLDPAMPAGNGATHSDPIMWPLVGNAPGTEFHIERDHSTRRVARATGLPAAFCVFISPIDRAVSRVAATFVRDFEAPPGTPNLLTVTV